jgi:hypothetical protein
LKFVKVASPTVNRLGLVVYFSTGAQRHSQISKIGDIFEKAVFEEFFSQKAASASAG